MKKSKTLVAASLMLVLLMTTGVFAAVTVTNTDTGETIRVPGNQAFSLWGLIKSLFGGGITGAAVVGNFPSPIGPDFAVLTQFGTQHKLLGGVGATATNFKTTELTQFEFKIMLTESTTGVVNINAPTANQITNLGVVNQVNGIPTPGFAQILQVDLPIGKGQQIILSDSAGGQIVFNVDVFQAHHKKEELTPGKIQYKAQYEPPFAMIQNVNLGGVSIIVNLGGGFFVVVFVPFGGANVLLNNGQNVMANGNNGANLAFLLAAGGFITETFEGPQISGDPGGSGWGPSTPVEPIDPHNPLLPDLPTNPTDFIGGSFGTVN